MPPHSTHGLGVVSTTAKQNHLWLEFITHVRINQKKYIFKTTVYILYRKLVTENDQIVIIHAENADMLLVHGENSANSLNHCLVIILHYQLLFRKCFQ